MLSKPGQVCTLYSSITSRYILVVVFLLLLLTANMMHKGMCVQTLVLCGDQTQTALLVGEEQKYTSTQVQSTHWSHWSERVSLGKQSFHPTCSAHCVWLTHWKPLEYIAMLSRIGIQYNTLSVHDVLMLCHIRRPPQVETKVDRGRERDTCSFGFPGSRCIETNILVIDSPFQNV